MLRTPLVVHDGRLRVPDGPGIGAEVNEEEVARVATEHWTVDANGRRLIAAVS